jgi:hypothetical protein
VPLLRYLVSGAGRAAGSLSLVSCLFNRDDRVTAHADGRNKRKQQKTRNPFNSRSLFSVVGTQRDKIFGSSLFLLYILLLVFSPSFGILVIAVSLLLSIKQT